MSLFVGNISRNARAEDIEKEFKNFGPCRLKFKGSYAFIEYEEERDAEEAIRSIHNKSIGGRELNIEWSKNSGRFDPSNSKRRKGRSKSPRRRDMKEERCYKCGHRGHFAYDCRDSRRKSHKHNSRSRSRSRKHRRRSDSRHRNRSRSSHSSDRKKKSHRKKSISSKSRSNSSRSFKSLSSRKKDDKSPIRPLDEKAITNENNLTAITHDNLIVKSRSRSPIKNEDSKINVEIQINKNDNKLLDEILNKENKIYNDSNENLNKSEIKESLVEKSIKESNEEVYIKLKVEELKTELKKRTVPFSKNDRKNDLINLLKQNDVLSSKTK